MNNEECYIEFEISDDREFKDLQFVYKKFVAARDGEPSGDDKYWFDIFPDYAKSKFYFTDLDLRPDFDTAELSDNAWHFYSMVGLMRIDYDVDYHQCFRIDDNRGRLEFYPFNYPYGGITGMLVFIRSFNHIPYLVNEGSGLFSVTWRGDNDFELTEND